MSEIVNLNLSGVPETSLAVLYWSAMESQRPDAMMKDEKAVALVTQMSYDFDRVRKIPMTEALKVTRGYEKFIPGFKKSFSDQRAAIVAPVDLVPKTMLETRLFDVWKGWLYCLELRKPA